MLTLLGGLLVLAALLLLLPALLLFTQVVLACLPAPVRVTRQGKRARVAVLVPAHNEATLIASTLASIRPQLREGDQLLVVADNCTDQTASLARAAGAQVVERQDQQRRGKGYALDFGVQHLRQSPPDVLIIIDADCQVGADALEQLARCCVDNGRPAQALYLMHAPAGAGLKVQVAAFAWRVKNLVRPRGWARAGLPCQLMGAGMAFTWQDLSAVNLATGHLVEDLKLGLECAALGKPPLFCPEAVVNSHFPTSQEGLSIQRKRWEHGHLGVVLAEGPKLVGHALARGNWPLLGMAMDLLVPPLALLSLLLTVLFVVTWLAFGLFGLLLPALLATLALGLLGTAVLLAWARFAREVMPFSVLMYAPFYAARKIPLYLGFLLKRQVDWVRSKRDDS
ncbi:TPA: glycosyltransferase [Pseudomonas putida]|jgi:cellulose synthase/poly-beta-1,6-N-acetylglucosamine synthase-like glycosyltransferase|uniref:glycosyltransferase family 2 protein n=1 Tax=Pseudomonas TaxID=286 RepID=UPI0007610770|nr:MULTISPECIES: glycosyltransferase family 2 protein [Pseudomonas]MDD2149161.1 glycosyltransferase family 2 protein [Pseudomonas putida]HDS1681433.1 glycosyltransferase [Pseudomonas putida]